MDWFSRHTNWLYTETTELSNNSIYKERYQFIDKTLISTGDILVHKAQTQYFPILIVYPEATPYVPPTIYVLDAPLEEDVAREYSKQTSDEIKKHVQTNAKYFNRRHQNEDGSICFIERGDLHSENAEIYTIKEIMKRLRIWLSGKIPKDSREVELFHHFKNRTYEIQYLLPDLFFETEIIKGTFYAGLSSFIPANLLPNGIAKKTYMGVMIFGRNSGGVTIPPKVYIKKQLILFTPIPNIEDLIVPEKINAKREEIEKGILIEGYWWDISREPEPFSDISTLARYVGEDDENRGIEELIESLREPLSQLQDMLDIGLRFNGRWREKDWQMFRLKRGSRSPIVPTERDNLKERLFDYSVEAVYQEYFTDEYFHMRNKGRADRDVLREASISVIGCGAIGSEMADALNKAGVGRILLVDRDEMRAHNAIRHCLGIDNISLPKVYGMARHMVMHNPFVDIDINIEETLHLDILQSHLENYLPTGNIGLSTIADDNIEAYLNEQATVEGRTVFYCRALRGGKAARIFRVIPQKDACKACLSLYSKEDKAPFVNIEEDQELPAITNECNNPVRPASAADLKIVAGIFSRIVIDYLQGINADKNHWIWSTESLGQLSFESSNHALLHASNILPHPHCPICQKREDIKVTIVAEAYKFMKKESSDSKDIETGGVLIGHKASSGQYIILRATGPGPKAVRTKTLFEKDEEYCQKELEKAFEELRDRGLYLGEWHYHPIGSNKPSGLDIKSLTAIATQDNYRIDKPVMIIFSPPLEYALTIHDKKGQYVQLPLEVMN